MSLFKIPPVKLLHDARKTLSMEQRFRIATLTWLVGIIATYAGAHLVKWLVSQHPHIGVLVIIGGLCVAFLLALTIVVTASVMRGQLDGQINQLTHIIEQIRMRQ